MSTHKDRLSKISTKFVIEKFKENPRKAHFIQKAKAGIYILTSKLKRFRSFSGKCVRFFSGLFPPFFSKWFWNKAEKTPETDRKKRKNFPKKERYLNKNPQNREEFLEGKRVSGWECKSIKMLISSKVGAKWNFCKNCSGGGGKNFARGQIYLGLPPLSFLVCPPLSAIRQAKFNYYYRKFETHKNKPWTVIKELIGKDKRDDQSISKVIEVDGKELSDKCTIEKEFNNFFNQIGVKLGQTISSTDKAEDFRPYTEDENPRFNFQQVTSNTVMKIV